MSRRRPLPTKSSLSHLTVPGAVADEEMAVMKMTSDKNMDTMTKPDKTKTKSPTRSAKKRMEVVKINVGGKLFQVSKDVLRKYPETKLGKLESLISDHYIEDQDEYFFDRNPKVFTYIMNFYRTGQLHVPHNLCGPTIKLEFDFWQIEDSLLSPCCWKAYQQFEHQEKAMQLVDSYFGNNAEEQAQLELYTSGKQPGRFLLWSFLDDPFSSKLAMLFAVAFSFLLLTSVAVLFFDSLLYWRVQKSGNLTQPWLNVTGNQKLGMVFHTDPHPALMWIEDVLTMFFFVEWVVRFAVSLRKLAFLRNIFNIIDLFGIIPMTVRFVIDKSVSEWWHNPTLYWLYSFLRIGGVFRVLRLLKLGRHNTGLKVLILALKASIKELLLLMFLMFIGSLVFSVSVYLCELVEKNTFENMLDGAWWAMITMTTIGYGDLYPVTHLGRVVGILCALAGIIATGLPVPIISSNFDLYYGYAKISEESRKLERKKRQEDFTIRSLIQKTLHTTSKVTTKITVVKSMEK